MKSHASRGLAHVLLHRQDRGHVERRRRRLVGLRVHVGSETRTPPRPGAAARAPARRPTSPPRPGSRRALLPRSPSCSASIAANPNGSSRPAAGTRWKARGWRSSQNRASAADSAPSWRSTIATTASAITGAQPVRVALAQAGPVIEAADRRVVAMQEDVVHQDAAAPVACCPGRPPSPRHVEACRARSLQRPCTKSGLRQRTSASTTPRAPGRAGTALRGWPR